MTLFFLNFYYRMCHKPDRKKFKYLIRRHICTEIDTNFTTVIITYSPNESLIRRSALSLSYTFSCNLTHKNHDCNTFLTLCVRYLKRDCDLCLPRPPKKYVDEYYDILVHILIIYFITSSIKNCIPFDVAKCLIYYWIYSYVQGGYN